MACFLFLLSTPQKGLSPKVTFANFHISFITNYLRNRVNEHIYAVKSDAFQLERFCMN